MSMPLFKRNLLQMVKPIIIFVLVLAMYQGVIIYMYDPKLMKILSDYQKMMPDIMAAMGMNGQTDSLLSFINTYLYGILMQLFPLIFIVLVGNNMVIRYVDGGSMAVILSTPNSRKKVIATQVISMILSVIFLLSILTVTGYVFAEIMFKSELDFIQFLKLNGSLLLLQLAVSSIVFFASAVFNEKKQFYAVGCGIPLICYIMTMIANMGDKLSAFKYFSIYTLFPSTNIISGTGQVTVYNIVLIVISLIMFVGGSWYFTIKDLSL